MNRYVIAKGYSLEEMAQQVNEYAAQGYTPLGELINRTTLYGDGIMRRTEHMQPMWLSGKNKVESKLYDSLTNPAIGEPLEDVAGNKIVHGKISLNDTERVFKIPPLQPMVPSGGMTKRPQAVPEWQEREREYVEEIDRLNERIQVLTIDHSIMLNVSAEQNQQIAALEKTNSTLSTLASNRGHHIERLGGQINTLTADFLAAKERIYELEFTLTQTVKLAANSTTKP